MIWQPGTTLEEAEKKIILEALRFYGNNKTMTANSLGICTRTLANKLEQYGTKDPSSQPIPSAKIGPDTSGGLHVESVTHDAAQQSLSVPKRQEVQKVPPKQPSKGGSDKGGA